MTGRSQHSYDSLREYLAGNENNDNDIVNVVLSGAVNSGQETDNLISILLSFLYSSHHTTLLQSLTSLHLIYLFLKVVPVAGRLLCDKAVSLFGVYVREWGETDWTGHDEVTLLTGGGPTSGRLPDRPPAASTQAYQHSGSGWREREERLETVGATEHRQINNNHHAAATRMGRLAVIRQTVPGVPNNPCAAARKRC